MSAAELAAMLNAMADVFEAERDDAYRCLSHEASPAVEAGNFAAALMFAGLAKAARKAAESLRESER